MNLELKDKVYVITGGASGIGKSIALGILNEGGKPVIIDKDSQAVGQMSEELKAMGLEAHSVIRDLSESNDCKNAVDEIMEVHRKIDGLINNAGANDGIGLEHGSPAAYLSSLARNLHHYYYMAHHCLKALKESKGVILNISSKCGITGQGGTSAYSAAKGAQLALTREWAVELLPYNIRVNAILPAEVLTPLYIKWLEQFEDPKAKLSSISKNIPLGKRMTKPEEIANMAVFLLSEKAGHITGQYIHVDGGYVHLDRALAGLD